MHFYQCECPFLQYYDSGINKCINQSTANSVCTTTIECQTAYNFDCVLGKCM